MKLLLTSSGIANREIAAALAGLVNKPASQSRVGFIPTAANAEGRNKDWVIGQFINLWRYGYNWIDIIDPSADGVNWQDRLREVDIVFLCGGNTFHLLDQARKTGFDKWLIKNVSKKIFVGSSAGSILLTPTIDVAGVEPGDPNLPDLKDLTGLGLVDFEVSPHVPESVTYQSAENYAATTKNKVYAIDDDSAVLVDGRKVGVVGKGIWKIYN